MRTGLTKKQKTTVIYFDEHSRIIEVQTHNTDLKKRLAAFAAKHPQCCRQTDDDEQGGLTFEIEKGRLSFAVQGGSEQPVYERAANERRGGERGGRGAPTPPPGARGAQKRRKEGKKKAEAGGARALSVRGEGGVAAAPYPPGDQFLWKRSENFSVPPVDRGGHHRL